MFLLHPWPCVHCVGPARTGDSELSAELSQSDEGAQCPIMNSAPCFSDSFDPRSFSRSHERYNRTWWDTGTVERSLWGGTSADADCRAGERAQADTAREPCGD